MLIDEPNFLEKETDPVLLAIAEALSPTYSATIELRTGVYLTPTHNAPFGMGKTYKEYPDLGYANCYGVCDSVENLLSYIPELEASARKFVVRMTSEERDIENKGGGGGWRWHKWGPYIGSQDPQCEYLDDEPLIEKIYTYHIYEKLE